MSLEVRILPESSELAKYSQDSNWATTGHRIVYYSVRYTSCYADYCVNKKQRVSRICYARLITGIIGTTLSPRSGHNWMGECRNW